MPNLYPVNVARAIDHMDIDEAYVPSDGSRTIHLRDYYHDFLVLYNEGKLGRRSGVAELERDQAEDWVFGQAVLALLDDTYVWDPLCETIKEGLNGSVDG